MSKSQILGERVRILADDFLAIPSTTHQQRSLQAALLMFLDTVTEAAPHRAELVSKSAPSRLLNDGARIYSQRLQRPRTLLSPR